MRTGNRYFLLLLLVLCGLLRLQGAQSAPEFQQVYDLLKANLAGVSPAELNQTAVEALVGRLAPRVALEAAGQTEPTNAPLMKTEVFEGDLVCFRISRVSQDLGQALAQEYARIAATNKLRGVVMDLRFAGGRDYAAVAGAVRLFVRKDQPLIDFGQGMVTAKPTAEPITAPVAVLVNAETRGAAEALAAALRTSGAALVLGGNTAGEAAIAKTFPLSNGDHLRVATAPIRLGDGSLLSLAGLTPDIVVHVTAAQEKVYFTDPYREFTNTMAAAAGTNNAARRLRYGEAELVRERKIGPNNEPAPAMAADPEKPIVQDPALARALDVLKGLAVVRRIRP